jgi:hypothetical protein
LFNGHLAEVATGKASVAFSLIGLEGPSCDDSFSSTQPSKVELKKKIYYCLSF